MRERSAALQVATETSSLPSLYTAENHDWDLTLRAAHELLMLGQMIRRMPDTTRASKQFSCWTGSMLLSFCAIESDPAP